MQSRKITLYHWPQSRSIAAFILLEELRAEYDLHLIDITKNEQKKPEYLALNPMGKIPAIKHGEVFVSEQIAVFIYLADLYADRGLAPSLNDPLRGPYLRWMAYYAGCLEPALTERSLKREPGPPSRVPWGDFDLVWNTIVDQVSHGPYFLGKEFSALDVLWGVALSWMTQFDLAPKNGAVLDYIKRIESRPTFIKAKAKNQELMDPANHR